MKKALIIIVCTLLVLLLAGAAACAIIWDKNEFSLELTMAGDEEITLEYGSEYIDPGASASFQGTLLNKEATDIAVAVSGQVDTSTVGVYYVTYTASHIADYRVVSQELSDSKTRTIRVIDKQAPTITLVSDPDHFTFPNETYAEEGFSAFDDYDGDITHRVERIETAESITYRVSDSSGNACEVVRSIVYDDPVAPVLTLQGEAKVTVEFQGTYEEPGFTAEDNVDGDITAQVTVEGQIDTSKAGDYTLTYTVSDAYGNSATAERVVTVLKKGLPNITIIYPDPPLEPTGKVIYLTFDDGPGKHTARLLDILAKYGVKATFFVTCNGNPDLITRMANEGHTVAMHTATHDYYTIYTSEEAFLNDLYTIQSIIAAKTGVAPKMFRFPGGSGNTVSGYNPGIMTRLTELLTEMGYTYYDWNVDSGDAAGASSAQEIFYNVVAGIGKRNTSIVLQHDIYSISVDAAEEIIKWGIANGYTFLPLDESSPTSHHTVRN